MAFIAMEEYRILSTRIEYSDSDLEFLTKKLVPFLHTFPKLGH